MGLFLEPKDLIAEPMLGWAALVLQRIALPLVWLSSLAGLAGWLKGTSPGTRVLAGAALFTLPIQICQAAGIPVTRGGLLLLFGLGLLGQLLGMSRGLNWRRLILPLCVWLFFIVLEAPGRLPAFGDPLAFLIYSKELLLSQFQTSFLDPYQKSYPDLLLNHIAGFSSVAGLDPIDSLMGLSPMIGAAAVLAWLGFAGRLGLAGRLPPASRFGLLAALFALASARNPLRYGIMAGRLPYLLAFAGFAQLCALCIDLVQEPEPRRRAPRAVAIGLLAAFVFLAHASFLPLLAAPFLLLARFEGRAAIYAATTCLIAVLPRAALLVRELKNFSARVETYTPAWHSWSDLAGGIRLSIQELWASVAVSPLCQALFVAALVVLLIKRPSLGRLRWFMMPLLLILFWGASGLTETLGLKMFSSHYGARHLGLAVMLVIWLGWDAIQLRSRPALVLVALAMAGHVAALGVTFFKERFVPSVTKAPRALRAESMAMIQALQDEEAARPGSIRGLVPPVRFNAVIPFALVQGDVEYFPYFLPQKPMLLTFVPGHGFDRSIPDHVELARRWMASPTDPATVSSLKQLGLNLVWLPESDEFAPVIRSMENAPSIYHPWRRIGREVAFGF